MTIQIAWIIPYSIRNFIFNPVIGISMLVWISFVWIIGWSSLSLSLSLFYLRAILICIYINAHCCEIWLIIILWIFKIIGVVVLRSIDKQLYGFSLPFICLMYFITRKLLHRQFWSTLGSWSNITENWKWVFLFLKIWSQKKMSLNELRMSTDSYNINPLIIQFKILDV